MKRLIAPYIVADELMTSLFNLYMCAAFSFGASTEEEGFKEGTEYAMNKFIQITKEFEKEFNIEWEWINNKEK